MNHKYVQLKKETNDLLVDKIRSLHSKAESSVLEEFALRFFTHTPPEDYVNTNIDRLYGYVSSLWRMTTKRPVGTPIIRIFNPTIEDYGWESPHTTVMIANDDMPFLVDSIIAAVNSFGSSVHLMIHPVFHIKKDKQGNVVQIAKDKSKEDELLSESYIILEVDQLSDKSQFSKLSEELMTVLADVRVSVEDWLGVRKKLEEVVEEVKSVNQSDLKKEDVIETQHFLKWIEENNFTFLGYRKYNLVKSKAGHAIEIGNEKGLGILRNPDVVLFNGLRQLEALPPNIQYFIHQPTLMMVTKTNTTSRVHRRTKMDAIFIKIFNNKGEVVGEHLFIGLFTSTAYNRSVREIPFISKKLQRTIKLSEFPPHGHSAKALTHIIETYPRDELFQVTDEELFNIVMGIMHLQERQRIALFLRKDPFERFMSCLLYVPKDKYDTQLRLKAQKILEECFNGQLSTHSVEMSEGAHAQVHFVISTKPGHIPDYEVDDIEQRLTIGVRTWHDDFIDSLMSSMGEVLGKKYRAQFSDAFSPAYQQFYSPKTAVLDIKRIEKVLESKDLAINLYRPFEARPDEIHFKIYQYGTPLPLSAVLPIVENMGLLVETEKLFEVKCHAIENSVWIHDFVAFTKEKQAIDIAQIKDNFQECFSLIWAGKNEDDSLNGLTLLASLDWRESKMLRVYAKYLQQAQFPYPVNVISQALSRHREITRALVDFFKIKFDPDYEGDRREDVAQMRVELLRMVDQIASIDEDKIIKSYINIIDCTLRTNFFQKTKDGNSKPYVSIKIDSQHVTDLPLPRPMVEVFVFSPHMEGIHLRGGKVARGGIRWSDRTTDFRTEILGLMKAQMVKNTVIVPLGSKGGFVAKKLPDISEGREKIQVEVIECYKTLIRGLLDITDNVFKSKIVKPSRVICYDEDDPYLVVAADKGTATFSDIANSVSIEYDFWLNDAFASGGSAGYDHKKMGITAKGAWESVKRHFREIGKNIQEEEFGCIGVGDMAGDVFGNGMLLSKKTKLYAAFNHMHIFCDPNPNTEKSFQERQRLFNLPRSTWQDYDPKVLSKGGMIFERSSKKLTLTPEIMKRFNITQSAITPNELIKILLTSEQELLWFGGIGTFIKGSAQSNSEVGDKANDAVRVSAKDIRAKVIGEGANLGVTQYGRIEFALRGGHINTDAIDNSAGVDTSDHEVNIKILMRDLILKQDLTLKQRDELLVQMTDEVADLVLADNYWQPMALTLASIQNMKEFDHNVKFMQHLERSGHLNREVEMLPSNDELARRRTENQGFTRPELAVLLAYSKITFYDSLLKSDFPDQPYLGRYLLSYFPKILQQKYESQIKSHQLKREITSTVVTNMVLNNLNFSFVHKCFEQTGYGPAEISNAFILTKEIYNLDPVLEQIFALDNKVSADVQMEMMLIIRKFLQKNILWLMSNMPQLLEVDELVASYKEIAQTLFTNLSSYLSHDSEQYWNKITDHFISKGVPAEIAHKISSLNQLKNGYDLIAVAQNSNQSINQVAKIYYEIGHQFGITKLRLMVEQMLTKNDWQLQANEAILDDLRGRQRILTLKIIQMGTELEEPEKAVTLWVKNKMNHFERLQHTVAELQALEQIELAGVTVANNYLKAMILN